MIPFQQHFFLVPLPTLGQQPPACASFQLTFGNHRYRTNGLVLPFDQPTTQRRLPLFILRLYDDYSLLVAYCWDKTYEPFPNANISTMTVLTQRRATATEPSSLASALFAYMWWRTFDVNRVACHMPTWLVSSCINACYACHFFGVPMTMVLCIFNADVTITPSLLYS